MKTLLRLLDRLLIRAIALTGVQVYGLEGVVDMDGLPEYLDPPSRHSGGVGLAARY